MDINKLEIAQDYAKKLKSLQYFEEDLANNDYISLRVETWSGLFLDYLGTRMNIEEEPEIRKALLTAVRERIEYYKKQIEGI